MAFDPDAYLAKKSAAAGGGFDPDAYLAKKAGGATETAEPPPATATLMQGLSPRLVKAREEGAGAGRQALSAGLDALSLPGRSVAAATEKPITPFAYAGAPNAPKSGETGSFTPEGGREFSGSQADIEGKSLAGKIVRDPGTAAALATLPVSAPLTAGKLAMTAGLTGGKRLALGGLAESTASAAAHQADRLAKGGKINPTEALIEMGLGAALPAGLSKGVTLGKKLLTGSRQAVSALSDIPEDVLQEISRNPEKLETLRKIAKKTGGEQQKLANDVLDRLKLVRNTQDDAARRMAGAQQQEFTGEILDARPGGAQSLDDISGFDAGKRIESTSQQAMETAGNRFQEGQEKVLDETGAAGKKLLWQFRKSGQNENALAAAVDDYLEQINYNPELGYGVVGNRVIPKGAVREITQFKPLFNKAKTTRDILDMRRLFDQRISFGGPENGRLFAPGSDDDMAVKQFRNYFNDIIDQQIRRAAPPGQAEEMVDLWRANNESFTNTRRALESVQDGLGAGRVNAENYFSKIKDIGIEDLQNLKRSAESDEALKPVWDELERGFFDNIIKKGLKEGGLDYGALSKFWKSMDGNLKITMMKPETIQRVDDVISRMAPRETAASRFGKELGGANLDEGRVLKTVENIGTKDKRMALKELEALDDLLGLEGPERFSQQAMDAFQAKQLQITPEGNLPTFNNSRTGKSFAGLSYGELLGGGVGGLVGGLSGGFMGGAAGGYIGKVAGGMAGAYAQSPAGALAAFRLLNSLEDVGRAATQAGVGTKTARASRYGLFRPQSEEK